MNDSRQPDPTHPMGPSDDPASDVTRTRAPALTPEDATLLKSATPASGGGALSGHDHADGAVTDRYRLGDVIARGGMGVVYRAEDVALGREVAIKVLGPRLAHTSAAARFREEARITGRLQHPGIPPVHDLGELPDGRPFLAMKLIKGRTLSDEIKARPFTSDDFDDYASVFEQVCLAVAFAHSRGIIHRDLKPANIMVGAFGEVQVMDWGLAKVAVRGEGKPVEATENALIATPCVSIAGSHVGSEDRTEAGEVLGTPAYMPPEQVRGQEVNERADVFALGGILCAMLTGEPPYTGQTNQEVWKKASGSAIESALARLDAVTGTGQFRAIAKRCLHLDPARRYAHAGEVAAAVHAARAKARDVARRDELVGATEEADRRRAGTARWARLAVVFGIAGLAIGLLGAIAAAICVDYAVTTARQATAEREKLDAEYQKELFPTLVAAAHRFSDEGAFNPGADPEARARIVGQLQRNAGHLAPTDAAHVHVLLYGASMIAKDPEAGTQWARAVEDYKAVAPNHTEVVFAIEAVVWFTRHKPASKMDRTVLPRANWVLESAAGNPSLPDDLRKRAAALSTPK
jgi:hypothetical protein